MPGPGRGGGRHAPAVLPVRAPVPDTGLGRRAHAARGRRPDHASDRAGLPRAGGDHGPADQQAKRTVSGVRFNQPGDVATVLRVLYLVFNEGYSGDVDLAAEAIRLTRQLAAKINHEEVAGLLALMLLHHARRPARTRTDGSLVPLTEQDRSLWDTRLIAEGVDVLQAALARAVQEADIPCTSLLTSDHRKRNGQRPRSRCPGTQYASGGCRKASAL